MKSHYISISNTLENYATPLLLRSTGNWKRALFDDATQDGKQIRYVQLRSNREGHRIGILGEKCFYEASEYNDRSDTLFVFRVESILTRKAQSIPLEYKAQFMLQEADWRWGNPIRTLDPVLDIITGLHKAKSLSCMTSLGDKLRASSPQISRSRDKTVERLTLPPQPQASMNLRRLLGQLSAEQIEPWRPGECNIDAGLDDDTLNQLRGVWKTHRLSGHLDRVNRKTRLVLEQSSIRCDTLSAEQRGSVWSMFGTKMLNKFALFHHNEPEQLSDLLDALSSLAIPDDIRALVWTGRLAAMSPKGMRRELFTVAEALAQLEISGPIWEQHLLKALDEFAAIHQDDSVNEILEEARESETPLLQIVAWARDLVVEQFDPRPLQDDLPQPPPEPALSVDLPPPVGGSTEAPPEVPPEEPEVPEESASVRSSDEKRVFDAWLMALVAPDRETLKSLSQEFEARLERILDRLLTLEDIEAVFDLQKQLEVLRGDANRWVRTLPRREDHKDLLEEAQQAFQMGWEVLGGALEQVLLPSDGQSGVLDTEGLLDVLVLLEEGELLDHMPTWLWSVDALASAADRAVGLRDEQVRLCLKLIKKHQGDLKLGGWRGLENLDSPGHGQDELDIIENYIKHHQNRMLLLTEASETHKAWITLALDQGMPPEEIEAHKDRIENVGTRIEEELLEHICAEIAARPDAIEAQIEICLRDINDMQDMLTSMKGIRPAQFEGYRTKMAASRPRGELTSKAEIIPELGFDHVQVDHPHTRVSIAIRDYADETPYGFIRFPVFLTSTRAQNLSVGIQVEVQTQQRRNWPGDWKDPTPTSLDIRKDQWRRHENKFQHPFVLEIPLRRPKASEPFSFTVSIRHMETGEVLATSERFRWNEVILQAPELRVVWPDRLDPDYVLKQPIGPQLQHKHLVDRCSEGGSFAVVAPRRFGKSTLVAYLKGLSKQLELVIPEPVVLTEHYDGTSLDHAAVWNHFSEKLIAELGVGLQDHQRALPDEKAFDHVRRQAKKQKLKGILLLFDEAQFFFPRNGGHQLGDRFKGAIERFWADIGAEDMVPVLFGFVGLPDFQERGGTNLMGLLRPVEGHAMDEVDLNRFLRQVTDGHFHTTKLARLKLAQVAGNLFILRTLLNKLVIHCERKGHHWAMEQDVDEVTEILQDELRNGEAKAIENYIRDSLNSAESVNEWKPHRGLPVALALAYIQRDGEVSQVRMEKAIQEVLNGWCESTFQRDSARLTYPAERITELVAVLRDNKILSGWNFQSPLLAAWLQGKSLDGYPADQPARRALFQGAIARLRLGALEKVSEGRQAQVFRHTDDQGQRWAVRKSKLDEEARERFLESLQTLNNLRHEHLGREEAAQYIFELRDMGLSDEDDTVAVQIYRWVEGFSLGEKRGKLPAPLVVEIGWKLATAVHLLHTHNILHRDIRPENIILSEDGSRPILIDFGLARSDDRDMATRLHNQEAPHEVQSDNPKWSTAVDVFMLASTLRLLADINHPQFKELVDLLKVATVHEPTKRISAEELAEHLRLQADSFKVRQQRDQIWQYIESKLQIDRHKTWYAKIVRKFKPRFQDLGLGLHDDIFERGCDIADFVNQVLESYPDSPSERLSLGAVKHANEAFGDTLELPEVALLHRLRTYRSHAATRRQDNRHQILQGFSTHDVRQAILKAALAIEACLGLRSMNDLIRFAIDGIRHEA